MKRDGTPPARDPSPFHRGERAVQERAGVRHRIASFEHRLFRDFIPDQHRELFAQLPYLIVGTENADHWPVASLVFGPPGFISSPDRHTLRVQATPVPGDPMAANLAPGAPIALLGIELQTRRRNRLNGTLTAVDDEGFVVHAVQSFGNCPKYIQAREGRFISRPSGPPAFQPVGPVLSAHAASIVSRSDTFFIASATAKAKGGDAADGIDVSHRGGKPGFVRVSTEGDRTVLTWPDFFGNFFFNTLGNLQVNPRAGLLFVDFESGDVLSLTGQATITWSGAELHSFEGAERLLRLTVEGGVLIDKAVPLHWSAVREARELEATGSWIP